MQAPALAVDARILGSAFQAGVDHLIGKGTDLLYQRQPLLLQVVAQESYAASSPVLGENSDSNISAKIRQISVAESMPASFS